MKTEKKNISIIILLFIICLCSSRTNAQISVCDYPITNNRLCDVAIHYEVTDCSNVICNSTYQIIGPGATFYITSSSACCATGYDIFIWVKEVDYVDVTGGTTAQAVTTGAAGCFLSSQTTGGGTAPPSCGGGSWGINCFSSGAAIN